MLKSLLLSALLVVGAVAPGDPAEPEYRLVVVSESGDIITWMDARLGGLSVSARALTNLTAGELALVWPSIAARAGARTDWRGTDRLVAFTREGRVGARISLSGGWDVARTRDAFELRRGAPRPNDQTRPLSDGLIVDAWTFRATGRLGEDAWTASLPPGVVLAVRPWRPGDRMRSGPGQPPRRVKRYLTDAHIGGTLRARWPVVLAGKEIVWIPGVRRGGAAAERPGRPGVPYRCELNDR